MAPRLTPEQFNRVFRARLKRAREGANLSQETLAMTLGIATDTYKKYENRPKSVLPPHLVELFCITTRASCGSLFTNKLDMNDRAALAATDASGCSEKIPST